MFGSRGKGETENEASREVEEMGWGERSGSAFVRLSPAFSRHVALHGDIAGGQCRALAKRGSDFRFCSPIPIWSPRRALSHISVKVTNGEAPVHIDSPWLGAAVSGHSDFALPWLIRGGLVHELGAGARLCAVRDLRLIAGAAVLAWVLNSGVGK